MILFFTITFLDLLHHITYLSLGFTFVMLTIVYGILGSVYYFNFTAQNLISLFKECIFHLCLFKVSLKTFTLLFTSFLYFNTCVWPASSNVFLHDFGPSLHIFLMIVLLRITCQGGLIYATWLILSLYFCLITLVYSILGII